VVEPALVSSGEGKEGENNEGKEEERREKKRESKMNTKGRGGKTYQERKNR
jgi:hypothetical protein